MICTPYLSDLHEFCRDDVRDCGCDCRTFYGFAPLDDADAREPDDTFDDDDFRIGLDRYERRVNGD